LIFLGSEFGGILKPIFFSVLKYILFFVLLCCIFVYLSELSTIVINNQLKLSWIEVEDSVGLDLAQGLWDWGWVSYKVGQSHKDHK
jgi:cell division septal protein FtsQ